MQSSIPEQNAVNSAHLDRKIDIKGVFAKEVYRGFLEFLNPLGDMTSLTTTFCMTYSNYAAFWKNEMPANTDIPTIQETLEILMVADLPGNSHLLHYVVLD